MRREGIGVFVAAVVACAQVVLAPSAFADPHDALIAKHAATNGVPEALIRRVIRIESRGNARAVHAGNYGLMQIRLGTARGVGYSGDAEGLLDPDTNLNYAVKYLAGAYRAAGCDADRAVAYYQRGYYGAALRECGQSPGATVKLAQAQPKPPDVIKPKVVRTETIGAAKTSPLPPPRPVGNFEPTRVTPPVQQVAVVNSTLVDPPAGNPLPVNSSPAMPVSTAKTDRLAPAAAGATAKFELASVPLPPVRPLFDPPPPPKHVVQSAHHSERRHARTEKKDDTASKLASAVDPANVVSMLKKLVTPDKKPSRHRAVEAEADPASHVQSPQ